MRVTVLGGAGVFGSRLALLLIRDGHEVTIAGRSPDALRRKAAQIGATALVLDRGGDLSPLSGVEVIVDAAGPFHAYGAEPYRLVRFCIDHGLHYLDLADDADFCAGISTLDAEARQAGVFALSGVSSVPALSSAVVSALGQGMQIDSIDMAILPGNRAPRGKSVVESILHQVGTPIAATAGGARKTLRSWSDPRLFDLGAGMVRQGWAIRVPDLDLFPGHFGARTVMFRAGMELGVMNYGLAGLSWLRARTGAGMPGGLVRLVHWAADRMERLGSDAGGMIVTVAGTCDGVALRRAWRLRVRDGEGPFIPAIAARAILRHVGRIPPGARPALSELPLDLMTGAMTDLAVETDRQEGRCRPLFPTFLGKSFGTLPKAVQALHQPVGPALWSGTARITRGTGLLPRLIATIFRFPNAGEDVPLMVRITPHDGGEVWDRTFAGQTFTSHLAQSAEGFTERFGAMTFDLDLQVIDGVLHFPVRSGRFMGLPIPRFALPDSIASETVDDDGRFRFDVRLEAPLRQGAIVHYTGWLTPANPDCDGGQSR